MSNVSDPVKLRLDAYNLALASMIGAQSVPNISQIITAAARIAAYLEDGVANAPLDQAATSAPAKAAKTPKKATETTPSAPVSDISVAPSEPEPNLDALKKEARELGLELKEAVTPEAVVQEFDKAKPGAKSFADLNSAVALQNFIDAVNARLAVVKAKATPIVNDLGL